MFKEVRSRYNVSSEAKGDFNALSIVNQGNLTKDFWPRETNKMTKLMIIP